MPSLVDRLLVRLARSRGFRVVRKPAIVTAPRRFDVATDAVHASGDIVFEIPLRRCVYLGGYGYGPEGWHPFVETLRSYREDPGLSYEDTVLARFYDRFRPANLLELYFPAPIVEARRDAPLARVSTHEVVPPAPWDLEISVPRGEKGLAARHGHQSFGPVSTEKGALEFARLTGTFDSIRSYGYRPERSSDGDIRGYFLVDGDRWSFVIRSGMHRTAALAALDAETVRVTFDPGRPRALHASTLDRWPLVRGGPFDSALARLFVDQHLDADGSWQARQLGMEH